jgi:hypothetical protein
MYVKKEKKKENVYLGYVGANTKLERGQKLTCMPPLDQNR